MSTVLRPYCVLLSMASAKQFMDIMISYFPQDLVHYFSPPPPVEDGSEVHAKLSFSMLKYPLEIENLSFNCVFESHKD